MRRIILAFTLILAAVPLVVWGQARVGFKAQLSGAEVVPQVKTEARGGVLFDFSPDGKSLHFKLSVENLADATAAQIHLGSLGKEGPVVATLYPSGGSPPVKAGSFSGILAQGVLTAANLEGPLKGRPLSDLLKEIQTGNTYIELQTKQHPNGEVRGQIVRRPA
jgi:hypothetical protein